MALKLFNSLSGMKEEFTPLEKGKVKMYVCGVTPYDTTHLGHAFTYVFFDVLSRYLSFKGFEVSYTQNVTDIDDDIIRKSREEKRGWKELGDFWTRRYLSDMKSLSVRKPTHYVKATETIGEMKRIIAGLLEKGYAYRSAGNVYFNVPRFKSYGSLSRFNQKQMAYLLRERGGNPDDPNKKDPLDFILWQKRKGGEPHWSSPWGEGRPGWHIECTAMIMKYLGEQIDIHGGGRDLVFPHHESEIAQAEGYTGRAPFSKYFVHTAMVMYYGEKMAKSLGNLVLVSDLLKEHSPNAIRWLLLSHSYRRVWEYDPAELEEADKFAAIIESIGKRAHGKAPKDKIMRSFEAHMDDDMDTEGVIRMLKPILSGSKDMPSAVRILGILGFGV